MTRRANLREMMAIRTGRLTRTRACARKHSFSQDKAIRMAEKRSVASGEKIVAYPCLFCGEWHIGHPSRR